MTLINKLPELKSYHFGEIAFSKLMQRRIYKVLIVCSNYDYYMLEEDGRIDEQIFNEYVNLNLRYPPTFVHANSGKRALRIIENQDIDLVITWLDAGSSKSFEVAKMIKSRYPKVPIAALSHYSNELRSRLDKEDTSFIDFVFHWAGDVDIFLAIIKLAEDLMNADNDILEVGVQAILLVEDSLRFYSHYLPNLYKIILQQARSFMTEGLNEHRAMILMRGRPKILLATNYEEGVKLFDKYRHNLLGVVSDVSYFKNGVKDPTAGFQFAEHVRSFDKFFPFLLQSSELKNGERAEELGIKFLYKHSEMLSFELKKYITEYFSFGNFEFWDPIKNEIVEEASDLKTLQRKLAIVPMESIIYHAKRNHFSKWLKSRALFPIANLFSEIEFEDFSEKDDIREYLVEAIKSCRIYRSRGVIAKFDRDKYDEFLGFSRIGDGALGGKGRGLAFIDSFLNRHKLFNRFPGISISIPRTTVLSTEVFDNFMEMHDLYEVALDDDKTDEEILETFISKPLPADVVKDIRAFLKVSERPVAVRSSSVLEDSHYQPFAGVYATYMVPPVKGNLDKTLELVLQAVKSVMASSFYSESKAYIRATTHSIDDDKMAVVLQEVTGKDYGDVYYPTFSGVARSINFYPIGDEQSKDGIANIALGLGEIIVGGERTLRVSPHHPKKILQLSSTANAQRDTQKHFLALDMDPNSYKVSTSETVNKKRLRIKAAEKHGSLKFVASTYDLQNNVVRPGMNYDGIRLVTFENILKHNTFPLAEILQELLRIGQREMRNPIEIEFAVNLDVPTGRNKVFSFLQIRPIVESNDYVNALPEDLDTKDCVIYSESALGNGKFENLNDIIYVKPETFDSSSTKKIAQAVAEINKKFQEEGKQYILIGPGRWGSSDPWLGIPVSWTQISSAKVIIESALENFRIDPSQGTHFFQNLTAFNVGYFTINPFLGDGIYDLEYLNSKKAHYEDDFIRHVRFKNPLEVIIEGRINKAAIFKEGIDVNNSLEGDDLVEPTEGFL